MPAIGNTSSGNDVGDLRVLITGFGPFAHFKENPSWMAVKTLHNLILETSAEKGRPKRIHITSLQVATSYKDVLEIIPRLHARPPVVPSSVQSAPPPPADGYDFILHVGVAPPDLCRLEAKAHKYGYNKPDANDELAPIVDDPSSRYNPNEPASEAELAEGKRLEGHYSGQEDHKLRGFGSGYEDFDEEIISDLNAKELVEAVNTDDHKDFRLSLDAGRYLCDFIYYCSLAEKRRSELNGRVKGFKSSRVLFLHCPPVDEPFSTEKVAECIKRVVVLVSEKIAAGRAN